MSQKSSGMPEIIDEEGIRQLVSQTNEMRSDKVCVEQHLKMLEGRIQLRFMIHARINVFEHFRF